jgi:hypothetical protein
MMASLPHHPAGREREDQNKSRVSHCCRSNHIRRAKICISLLRSVLPMPPIPKRKTERAPAVDKLLKPAIGVVVALLAYIITQAMKSEVRKIC